MAAQKIERERFRKISVRTLNDEWYLAQPSYARLLWLSILAHPDLTPIGTVRSSIEGLCAVTNLAQYFVVDALSRLTGWISPAEPGGWRNRTSPMTYWFDNAGTNLLEVPPLEVSGTLSRARSESEAVTAAREELLAAFGKYVTNGSGTPKYFEGDSKSSKKCLHLLKSKVMLFYDQETGLLAVRNFIRHNPPQSPNHVRCLGWLRDRLPEGPEAAYALEAMRSECLGRNKAIWRGAWESAFGWWERLRMRPNPPNPPNVPNPPVPLFTTEVGHIEGRKEIVFSEEEEEEERPGAGAPSIDTSIDRSPKAGEEEVGEELEGGMSLSAAEVIAFQAEQRNDVKAEYNRARNEWSKKTRGRGCRPQALEDERIDAAIDFAIKVHGVETARKAAAGIFLSDWNLGANKRGREYLSIMLAMKIDSHIDNVAAFADLVDGRQSPAIDQRGVTKGMVLAAESVVKDALRVARGEIDADVDDLELPAWAVSELGQARGREDLFARAATAAAQIASGAKSPW